MKKKFVASVLIIIVTCLIGASVVNNEKNYEVDTPNNYGSGGWHQYRIKNSK